MSGSHETFENVIATFVDLASIMVAYSIGMSQSSFLLGLAYGGFDAFIVVWMRKPMAKILGSAFLQLRGQTSPKNDAYRADI
jgi:hypothetical protein